MSPRTAGLLATGIAGGLLATGLYVAFDPSSVAPKVWAKSVCSALNPWRIRVADLTTTAQRELGGTGTPWQTKQALTTLLGGAEAASGQARAKVINAGIPAVDGGKAAATQFVTALTRARDAYGHARSAIAALETARAQPFYDGVADAFATLNTEYAASSLDIGSIASPSLRRSFDEVPECG